MPRSRLPREFKQEKKKRKNVEKTFCGIERAAAFPYTAQCSVIRVLFSSFLSFFISLSCFACLFLFLSFSINLKTNTAGHVQQKTLEATVDKKKKKKKMLLPCGFRRPILQPQFPQTTPQTLHFLPTACIGRQAFTYYTYRQLTVNILPGYLPLMIIVIQSSWVVYFLLISLSLSVVPTQELIAQK